MSKDNLLFPMLLAQNGGQHPLIESVADHSTTSSYVTMTRAAITFRNGLGLSVIRSEYSYGGKNGLYEIAPRNLTGGLDGAFFDEGDQGDDVLGHCSAEEVRRYINKIGILTMPEILIILLKKRRNQLIKDAEDVQEFVQLLGATAGDDDEDS